MQTLSQPSLRHNADKNQQELHIMFKKGIEFVRKSRIFYDYGQNIDRVEDLSLEQHSTQLLGALVQERGWSGRTEVTSSKFSELDQTTSNNMKDMTQTTDDKLHQLSQTASHEGQETSQLMTEDLRGSGRYTNQTAQETA
ncbi:MAG: hypothetical protein EYR95_06515 [Phormidium sp. SL48-SHIP]|nr:MAG: hypothetical protein EYR95_06515 [Phormidium sp. SL48-SHIP]